MDPLELPTRDDQSRHMADDVRSHERHNEKNGLGRPAQSIDNSHDDQIQPADSTIPSTTSAEKGPSVQLAIEYPSGLSYWLAVTALCLGIFLATLDSTIIATAAPYITDQFDSLEDVGWYANIYPLAIASSQLLYGKLASRYPIRWIYSIAMALFLIGSAVCASAPSSPALIAGRAISGLGSSGLLIGAYSLVSFLAPPAKRPTFFSLISAARGIAATCGPLIGGALTERVSWRWSFYINLPLGAAVYAVFFFTIKPPKRVTENFTSWGDFLETLDLVGLVALVGSVVCLFLALQWGGVTYSWSNGRIIALLVLFGVLGLAFIWIEIRKGNKAMLPSRVFTQRTVLSASLFAFCTAGAIFVITFYFPIWLQAVKQRSPLDSGIGTLPWVITSTISALAAGVLISKIGHTYAFMVIGSAICSIGSGIFTTFQPDTIRGKWIGYQIVYAVGSSLASFTPLVVIQSSLPVADIPIGSGMVTFSQTMGSALAVSIAQALFTNDLSRGLQNLGVSGFDASSIATGGILSLTHGLSSSVREQIIQLINDALTSSWYLAVVLSCLSILGALAVERPTKKKESAAV